MPFPLSEGLLRPAAREPTSGGVSAIAWPCQRRQIGGKLHPNLGYPVISRIKIRSYDVERAERPEG
jgi:hypothetical protein